MIPLRFSTLRIAVLAALAFLALHTSAPYAQTSATSAINTPNIPTHLFGFRDFTRQANLDRQFIAVPDPQLARQHLKALTAAPHWASSPEDYATALYVAARFRAAGLQTEIVPYKVLLNKPISIELDAFDETGRTLLHGPTPEHVQPDPTNPAVDLYQRDRRVLPGFNDSSPAVDLTAPVIYANYGRLADFQRLSALGVSVKGKIVLVRYGEAYRGVKVYIAQQFGAKGVLIYTDPADDTDRARPAYPAGPDRPATAVQRGSIQFLPIYPGDPTTPSVASLPSLPASKRIPADKLQYVIPTIPAIPLSSADAAPILRSLTGHEAPHDWQGGLGFPYHLGSSGSVSVHLRLTKDSRLRTIWDVIGKIPGATDPHQLVIAGNHRDAWVYGASDPSSGTAAMLEAVHGLGVLLSHGWRPNRTIILASWDAEEEGMIGSTEWVEQHAAELQNAVAYFNIDIAVSGPNFNSAAVPSLHSFLRQIADEVPSPGGGSIAHPAAAHPHETTRGGTPSATSAPTVSIEEELHIGELGSGSDYTPFLQHMGIPSTDIASDGPFSVYHSVYDNFDWFTRFADPTFAYTQQQARFLGLEILHMADADVLPYNYPAYAQAVHSYLEHAHTRALAKGLKLDFTPALAAAAQFTSAAAAIHTLQSSPPKDSSALDHALAATERALLLPAGLPRRPWYKHSIYAPGEFTGYEAVVIPGVNEAIDASDASRAQTQLDALTQALNRAATTLISSTP